MSESTEPRYMTPEEIGEMMVVDLQDGGLAFRDGTCVRHGYAVDEPVHFGAHSPSSLAPRLQERIAHLVDAVRDLEMKRWQDAIDDIVVQYDPDRDGSGCESGDPLDLTLAEISGAFDRLSNALYDGGLVEHELSVAGLTAIARELVELRKHKAATEGPELPPMAATFKAFTRECLRVTNDAHDWVSLKDVAAAMRDYCRVTHRRKGARALPLGIRSGLDAPLRQQGWAGGFTQRRLLYSREFLWGLNGVQLIVAMPTLAPDLSRDRQPDPGHPGMGEFHQHFGNGGKGGGA